MERTARPETNQTETRQGFERKTSKANPLKDLELIPSQDDQNWMAAYKDFAKATLKHHRRRIVETGQTGQVNHLDHHVTERKAS